MSLSAQLSAQQQGFQDVAPQEVQDVMANATARLAESGIVDKAPKPGAALKNFSLPNQIGELRFLEDLRAQGPVVVTFYRGGWCPYCNLELQAWQASLEELNAAGATLVAITPELPDESLSTIEKNELGFEVLTDTGSAYAKELGLVFSLPEELRPIYAEFGIDIEKHNGVDQFDLPLAATFVVDTNGLIVSAFVDADYTTRQEPSDVIATLKSISSNA